MADAEDRTWKALGLDLGALLEVFSGSVKLEGTGTKEQPWQVSIPKKAWL